MLALGLVLLTVAVLLGLAEAHLTTGGMIAGVALIALVGGVVALLIGAGAGLPVVLVIAGGLTAVAAASLALLVRGLRSLRQLRPRSGVEAMVGHVGVVRVADRTARVFVDGSLWRAQPSALEDGRALRDGDQVVVERVQGLTLGVRRAVEWELNP